MTDAEKIRRLPWGVAGDAATTVFGYLSLFGSPFVLMLGLLGLPKTQIGLLLAMLPFFGVTALVTAPWTARWGVKRSFLTFWAGRYLFVLLLLLLPGVVSRWGAPGAFYLVAAMMAGFALCRSVGETAAYAWSQETIPSTVRAKYIALDTIVASIVGAVSILAAGYVLSGRPGLSPFLWLIVVGVAFGLAGTWCLGHLPGGAPVRGHPETTSSAGLLVALRDRNFMSYLAALGAFNLTTGAGTFVPLYLEQQIGLTQNLIVWLQIAGVVGTVLTSYFWGWAADRYGGKPVVLSALPLAMLTPLVWFALPRHSPWSVPVAAALYAAGAAIWMGWVIGTNRLLFVKLVPQERKTQYMAVFYAWAGVMGGLAPLGAGWALDFFKDLNGSLGRFTVDQYTPLWAFNIVMALVAILWFTRVRASGELGVREFTGMFLHGNPLQAAEALIRHSFAVAEDRRVSTTEMMGRVRSPLYVEELIQTLHDPSFSVRHEAILALAHMAPDERITAALVEVLQGRQPDLAVAAAWALARLGDPGALGPLRQALDGSFPMVSAASARALGKLNDAEAAPLLLARMRALPPELRTPYAAALGNLRTREATSDLLEYLRQPGDCSEELALSVARMVGGERHFIQLWRALRTEIGPGAAQAARNWKTKLKRRFAGDEDLAREVDECARDFLGDRLGEGVEHLRALLKRLLSERLPEPLPLVMHACEERLAEFGAERKEWLLLSLHVIGVALTYTQEEAEDPLAKE
ncbi:MAG TPA: MFS transporter [Armatimonadota bacterium]|jgi:hypothetical protein